MGVATSTDRDKACAHLESVGLLRYFSVLVGGNEVERPKPAPDIYIEAARRLGVLPALSLAVEDSPVGVRSAHAAGFSVIMVPDLLSPSKEIEALTIGILPSLHAMLLQLEPVTDGRRREMGG